MYKSGEFHPLDESGNEIDELNCEFDKQGTCKISYSQYVYHSGSFEFKPKVLFHKGDKKPDINQRLIDSLSSSVTEVRSQLSAILDKVETLQQGYEQRLASIFVPVEKVAIALDGITEQISQLKLRIKDCERLEALCK